MICHSMGAVKLLKCKYDSKVKFRSSMHNCLCPNRNRLIADWEVLKVHIGAAVAMAGTSATPELIKQILVNFTMLD